MTGLLRTLWTERRALGGSLLLASGLLILVGAVIGRIQFTYELGQIPAPKESPAMVAVSNPLSAIHQMNFLDWANRREALLKRSMPIPGGNPGQFAPEEGPWPEDLELLDQVGDFLDSAELSLNPSFSFSRSRKDELAWPGGTFSRRLMYGLANRALYGDRREISLQRMDQLLKAHLPVRSMLNLSHVLTLLKIRDQTLEHLVSSGEKPTNWTDYSASYREWLTLALDGERIIYSDWTRRVRPGLPQSQLKALPSVLKTIYVWLAGPGRRSQELAVLRHLREALEADQPLESLLDNLPHSVPSMGFLARQISN